MPLYINDSSARGRYITGLVGFVAKVVSLPFNKGLNHHPSFIT